MNTWVNLVEFHIWQQFLNIFKVTLLKIIDVMALRVSLTYLELLRPEKKKCGSKIINQMQYFGTPLLQCRIVVLNRAAEANLGALQEVWL